MTYKIAGAAFALMLGSGVAFADTHDAEDVVMVNVDGEMVETDLETAAAACGVDAATIEAQAGTDVAVCDIDQATAEEHGIEVDAEG